MGAVGAVGAIIAKNYAIFERVKCGIPKGSPNHSSIWGGVVYG